MSKFEEWCYDHCFSVTNPSNTYEDISVIRTDVVIELFEKLEKILLKEVFDSEN